jgi:multiple sugar transport system substrate-binding protein
MTLLTLFFLLLTALAVPVAGQDDEMIELRIAWWGSQNRHDRTIAVIELYEELNPNIDIVFEFQGWNDHWTKMSTQAAGGNLPDIMQQDYARIEEWVGNDLLMPLGEFIESGAIDTTNISDAALAGGMVDGQLYGFNLGNNSEVFALDVDAFEAAGIELPPADWTWTDFEETVMALHEELGIWGFGDDLSTEQLWKSLYMGCCDQWSYNAEGTALGYEDDQPLIDFYNMILRLQDAGAIPSREIEVAEYEDQGVEVKATINGDAAMDYFWSNQIVAVWTAAGEDRNFVLYHVPRPEGGQPQNYIKPSMFFSITSHSQHPEEAAAFIDFFTNSVEANEILFAERGVPISSEIRDALAPDLGPAQAEMFAYLGRVEADNSPIRPADPPGHADVINNIFNPEFVDPVLYGMISVEEAAEILREEANAILAQNE